MGASISNMGGGMDELFSWSDDTSLYGQITHTFTNAEITALKEYCSMYYLICFEQIQRGNDNNYGYAKCFQNSKIVTANELLSYLETPLGTEASKTKGDWELFSYTKLTSKSPIGSETLNAQMSDYLTNAHRTFKIYGIKY